MSRLQDISRMNLADLDRPGQTASEEDSTVDTAREEAAAEKDVSTDQDMSEEDGSTYEENALEEDIPEAGEETVAAEKEAETPGEGTEDKKPEGESQAGPEEKQPKKMMDPVGEHYYVDAELEENDLVSFMLNHSYRQPLMILVTILGIVWPIMAWYRGQSMVIPLIGAACILLLMPGTTYLQGKRAKKTMPIYQEVFHYMFDEWGMHLEVSGEAIDVEWKRVIKVVALKTMMVLYTGKNNAFLVPTKSMGPRAEEIKAFIYRMTGK